jgi:ABC-type transport system substrate-binding protein
MRRTDVWTRGAAFALGLALLASSCGSSESSAPSESVTGVARNETGDFVMPSGGDPKTGGVLTYALEAEPESLDPSAGRWAISTKMIGNAVYDPLVALDTDENIQPYLLESMTHNEGFTEWTLTLRSDVKFHDGEAVTAEHLARLFRALKASELARVAFVAVDSIETSGERGVVLKMSLPWSSFPASLLTQVGYLPRFDENLVMDATNPMGSGPFTWKSTTAGVIELARNDGYWQTDAAGRSLPYLDGVKFRIIADNDSRVNALVSGDVNLIHMQNPQAQSRLLDEAGKGNVQAWEDRGSKEKVFVMSNTAVPPLDDVRMRRALAYATDAAAFRSLAGTPEDLAATSAYPPGSRWHVDTPEFPTYDLQTAKDLVAVYTKDHDGATPAVRLLAGNDPAQLRQAQFLQEQWQRAGITVDLETMEQTTQIATVVTGQYNAVLWRQFGYSDPDAESHFWSSSNALGVGKLSLNMAQYKNDIVNDALTAARTTDDVAERKAEYDKMQIQWSKDVPYLWINDARWIVAADRSVRGVGNAPLPDGQPASPFQVGTHRLTEVWFDR